MDIERIRRILLAEIAEEKERNKIARKEFEVKVGPFDDESEENI